MTISFDIPKEIEQKLSANGFDLNGQARELFLVGLYRDEQITHHQLAQALGLSRLETEAVLKRHKVWLEITQEEVAAQAASLREARGE
jgi:hypothetical protein